MSLKEAETIFCSNEHTLSIKFKTASKDEKYERDNNKVEYHLPLLSLSYLRFLLSLNSLNYRNATLLS